MIGNADPDDTLDDQTRFGPYVAARVIGRGAMGTVYAAQHPRLGKRVAIKVLKRELAGDPVAEARFLREAQAVARISHPHVVDVFDVGVDDGRPFLVMELLEGETLDALLARGNRVGVERVVDVLLPLVSAVAAIHDAGVVHRDLKPGNVMLARRGRFAVEPVVLDFSVSRSHEGASPEAALTDPEALVGTLAYLSPEQMRDARAATPASDQYALGVVLYECLTGRKPFASADRYELMHAAMTATVTPPSALNPAVPVELDQVVLRAIARRPDARYPTVRGFGSALLSFAERSTWKRWAAEMAAADQADATAALDETASDVGRQSGVLPSSRARAGRSRARRFAVPVALGGVSLLVAIALFGLRRGPEAPVARQIAPALEAVAKPARPPIDDGVRDPTSASAERTNPASPAAAQPGREAAPGRSGRSDRSRADRAIVTSSATRRARPPGVAAATAAAGSVHKTKHADDAGEDDPIEPFAPVR